MKLGPNVSPSPRRGWRERLEPGMYRIHAVACPRSLDHRPGGRCDCPLSLVVPGASPGKTRQVRHAGPIGDARAERRRLLAAGRIEVAGSCAEDADIQTLHDLVRVYFHSKTGALARVYCTIR